jgi:hypothetical protein
MTIPQIAGLAVEGLLGLLMAYVAYTIFAWKPSSAVTKAREALRYPRWYWVLAGITALIGAILLLASVAAPFLAIPTVAIPVLGSLAVPITGPLAALWMIVYFVVACFTERAARKLRAFRPERKRRSPFVVHCGWA